mmetsp:Transcript_29778/g.45401  ORF Transcript_29778/g.45401 Transcript_29778/m.45401 type:complete len:191 (-) Transcript_29778:41-613(-)|eukprot:CAMPEP_0170478876 /NCGR_PEP_ID=MMETSP0208-20121228/311_1 /TAXON_ID=197538 /ORGANISM="Strombidium inclinatum, Strain S3" /LENGTH=190 /DNA_ID=CAMNT_0010751205 /DNA_START=124 /DNA_END=696 /DNA_ORIENTATION=+
MLEARDLKTSVDRLQMELQKRWEMLDPSSKAQYKQKLTRFKEQHQRLRTQFRRCDERLNAEESKQKLNFYKSQGTKEQFDSDLRENLIKGTGEINEMDNKLVDIEKQGLETANIMQDANRDLRGQRDIIQGVTDKARNIQQNNQQAKVVIQSISKTEYKQRLVMYGAISLLFVTDILMVILIIIKAFSAN